MGDGINSDHAAGAGARLDVKLLAERPGQLVGGHAGQDVGGAARRKGIDDADRMRRPILSHGRRHPQRQGRKNCGKNRGKPRRTPVAHSAATRCAATPFAFTTTLIASSTRSLA